MKVKITLDNGAVVPCKKNPNDAGYDLYTSEDMQIGSGYATAKRGIAPLGIRIEMPDPCSKWWWKILAKVFGLDRYVWCAKVRPRSGFSVKGMEVTKVEPQYDGDGNLVTNVYNQDTDVLHGLVDEPYRGYVGVIVCNRADGAFIPKGTKIAQITFERAYVVDWEVVDELSDTNRGKTGFGNSGSR